MNFHIVAFVSYSVALNTLVKRTAGSVKIEKIIRGELHLFEVLEMLVGTIASLVALWLFASRLEGPRTDTSVYLYFGLVVFWILVLLLEIGRGRWREVESRLAEESKDSEAVVKARLEKAESRRALKLTKKLVTARAFTMRKLDETETAADSSSDSSDSSSDDDSDVEDADTRGTGAGGILSI